MGFQIEGFSSYTMDVDSDNRGLVSARTAKRYYYISRDKGEAYVFSSGDFATISTTGTETGFFHLKNTNSSKDLYVENVRTCGGALQKWKLYKNSTGGTLITDETAGSTNNINISSGNVASATVYKGANGKTVSGGTMLEHWINDTGYSTEIFDGSLILGFNDSIELSIEVDASQEVCCRVIGYFE